MRNGKPYAPRSIEELEILPGVPEALQRLRQAGFLNVVATNQPDVGAGTLARKTADALNAYLAERLALDAVKVCYHTEADNCQCRKPKPGMLLEAAGQWGIDVTRSFMVGDRWRDVAAAQAAGCQALFLDYGYDERRPDPPFLSVQSLAEAVTCILRSGQ